jgi:tetraacyldisaccharide 4'-kinase
MPYFPNIIHKVIHSMAQSIERVWWCKSQVILARLLYPLSILYVLLQKSHRTYQTFQRDNLAKAAMALSKRSVITIVVGNVVVGGAGKTPMTLTLLHWLKAQGYQPGVISRGYGSEAARNPTPFFLTPQSGAHEVGDEPLLIYRCTGAPVVVGCDRVAARQALLMAHPEVNVVIADDGLQHYRLARDLSIIVVDERGWGNGWCLPAGPLREPLGEAPPLNSLVVYSGGVASCRWSGFMGYRSMAAPMLWQDWCGMPNQAPAGGWESLRGRCLHAVAGIAVPERFFQSLREYGLQIEAVALPDHFDYANWVWPEHATDIVMTEKDAVKWCERSKAEGCMHLSPRIWVVPLKFEVELAFWQTLYERLKRYG